MHQVNDQFNRNLTNLGIIFYYKLKLEGFIGISTNEKNRMHIKNNFKKKIVCVVGIANDSAAGMSLALFSVMNEWHIVLFLTWELSQLLLVSKMFVY